VLEVARLGRRVLVFQVAERMMFSSLRG